ncbi:MAG TPA: beta-propeller fold lactonase family protein [Burkholderiaceae bacterium]|nr:beta-propeller fold lactonase family protein [Burkholderiaceae bacterium]
MRANRTPLVSMIVLVVAMVASLWSPPVKAQSNGPVFQVDPFWPKPLPHNWVTGEVGGTCVDSQDHVFIVTRGFQTGGLVSPEGVGGKPEKSTASPPAIEFDPEGNVVNSWGDPSIVASGPNAGKNLVLPNGIHGCFVDYQDNVWIAGNGDGVVQKYSHDGSTMLLQIGTKFVCDNGTAAGGACGNIGLTGNSTTLLNDPADIAVDPTNGDVYIADGYGNHRVVVFDKSGNYLRQMGGVGTGTGQFTAGDGGHPHCVVIGKDGLVYACDRGQDRINVYKKDGTPVAEIPVIPGTAALGTAGSAWDVDFSAGRQQTFMYESDGGNEVVWIFNHAAALAGLPNAILSGFGRPGHMAGEFTFLHMMAVDSRGNLYAGETIGGRRIQKFRLQGDD